MDKMLPTAAALALLFAVPAIAADQDSKTSQPSKVEQAGKTAGDIASQPAKDVGAKKTEIPPVLAQARADPYGLKGIKTCQDISKAFQALSKELGSDFHPGDHTKENKGEKMAEAGGKSVVNALIPFRGLVREATGAAPAQRRLNEAIDAGYARRGYLRGIHESRKCTTKLS